MVVPSPFGDELHALKEIESLLGPLPSHLTRSLTPEQVERMKNIEIDGWPLKEDFKSAYEEEDEVELDSSEDEDDFRRRGYEKANRDLSATDQEHALQVISALLLYSPEERGTEESLMRSRWLQERAA